MILLLATLLFIETNSTRHHRHLTTASCSFVAVTFLFSHSALLDISFFILLVCQSSFPHETCHDWTIEGLNEWPKTAARLARALPSTSPSTSLSLSLYYLCDKCMEDTNKARAEGVKCGRRRHSWMSCICKRVYAHTISPSLPLSLCALLSQHMHCLQSACKINGLICGRLYASGRSHTLSFSLPPSESWNKTRAFCL